MPELKLVNSVPLPAPNPYRKEGRLILPLYKPKDEARISQYVKTPDSWKDAGEKVSPLTMRPLACIYLRPHFHNP